MKHHTPPKAFISGAAIGSLGGLIGLGGAEFRLPLLVGWFQFRMLDAIVINLLVSLFTVFFSLVFRGGLAGFDVLLIHFDIVLNLLAGSLIGSWLGANYASSLPERQLKHWVVALLLMLSLVLMTHPLIREDYTGLDGNSALLAGVLAGLVIGVFSSLLGVAGGELIIPTILLIYGLDIKTAGTLSLMISLPTLLVGLSRYRQKQALHPLRVHRRFIGWMIAGSALGALMGAWLMQWVGGSLLHLLLGCILLISAWKIFQHNRVRPATAQRLNMSIKR